MEIISKTFRGPFEERQDHFSICSWLVVPLSAFNQVFVWNITENIVQWRWQTIFAIVQNTDDFLMMAKLEIGKNLWNWKMFCHLNNLWQCLSLPVSLYSFRFRFSRISVFYNIIESFKKIMKLLSLFLISCVFTKKTFANFRDMEILHKRGNRKVQKNIILSMFEQKLFNLPC